MLFPKLRPPWIYFSMFQRAAGKILVESVDAAHQGLNCDCSFKGILNTLKIII